MIWIDELPWLLIFLYSMYALVGLSVFVILVNAGGTSNYIQFYVCILAAIICPIPVVVGVMYGVSKAIYPPLIDAWDNIKELFMEGPR